MPKPRIGPVGLALTAWSVWRRLPKAYRKQIIREVRTHAPRIAASIQKQVQTARAAAKKKP